jgi:hypothetical protein
MGKSNKPYLNIDSVKLASECKSCRRYKGNQGACGGRNSLVNMCVIFLPDKKLENVKSKG